MVICHLRGHRVLRINDGISSISAGLVSQLPLIFFRSAELVAYRYVYQNWRLVDLPWDSPLVWWIAFLGVDLGYYWFHRMTHEVNILWASHQVHHSSEDYNYSTALRQSVFEPYVSWVFCLPISLFVPSSGFMVHIQFNMLYQFWIHTELVKSLGPLEYILNTPSHHRVHHGRNPYCIDKNYAGTLIIWDRMFGTFTSEKREIAYGLVHPLKTWDPFDVQLCHLGYMWKRFQREKGISNKLSVIFYGPGWKPGTPRLGNHEELPEVKFPVQRYDSGLPGLHSAYVLVHFVLVLVGYQEMVARKAEMSQVTVFLAVIYILYSLTCFGALNDRRSMAPYMECLRCIIFLGVDWYLSSKRATGSRSQLLYGLQAVFMLSVAFWVFEIIRWCSAGEETQKNK